MDKKVEINKIMGEEPQDEEPQDVEQPENLSSPRPVVIQDVTVAFEAMRNEIYTAVNVALQNHEVRIKSIEAAFPKSRR